MSGRVASFLDLAGLLPSDRRPHEEAVLNGIAYDPATRRVFVSGKLWPLIFEIPRPLTLTARTPARQEIHVRHHPG